MERWVGKTAVVTGAGSGNGAAITKALLRRGINVFGLDFHHEGILKAHKNAKGKIYAIQCDVTNVEAVDEAFQTIERIFGGVDILVNNAGVFNNAQLLDLTRPSEYYLATINTNIGGYLVVARRAFKSMKDKPFGYIININSTVGHATASAKQTLEKQLWQNKKLWKSLIDQMGTRSTET